MTHGIWGKADTFEFMATTLMMGPDFSDWAPEGESVFGLYWPGAVTTIWESSSIALTLRELHPESRLLMLWNYPQEASFAANSLTIRNGANKLLNQAINAGYSAGRVDVVAHSMGGLLTRLELQNTTANQNLIRSLITLDTPHWGSQFANWLEGGSPGATLPKVRELFAERMGNLDAPAVQNLRVGSPELQAMNLKLGLELKIPMHFVGGKDTSAYNVWWSPIRAALILAAKRDGYTGLGGVGNPGTLFTAIFGGRPHDEIVAIQSQLGGRPENHPSARVFPGKHHVGIMEQSDVIFHVFDVLQTSRTAPVWSASVLPVASDFGYEFQPGSSSALHRDVRVLSRDEGGIAIVAPTAGDILLAGQTAIIRVESTGSFENAALTIILNDTVEERFVALPYEGEFEIPESAIGDLTLLVYSLGDAEFSYDIVSVSIVPASDPVAIITNWTGTEFVLEGQDIYYSGSLLYESGGRLTLTDQNGGAIEIDHPELADVSEWGAIHGLAEGETTVTIRFGGLETSVQLIVLPGDAWDPVVVTGPGDINGDGLINVADVTELSNLIVAGDEIPVEVGDFNGDGVVNMDDVQALAELIAN